MYSHGKAIRIKYSNTDVFYSQLTRTNCRAFVAYFVDQWVQVPCLEYIYVDMSHIFVK